MKSSKINRNLKKQFYKKQKKTKENVCAQKNNNKLNEETFFCKLYKELLNLPYELKVEFFGKYQRHDIFVLQN